MHWKTLDKQQQLKPLLCWTPTKPAVCPWSEYNFVYLSVTINKSRNCTCDSTHSATRYVPRALLTTCCVWVDRSLAHMSEPTLFPTWAPPNKHPSPCRGKIFLCFELTWFKSCHNLKVRNWSNFDAIFAVKDNQLSLKLFWQNF